MRTSRDSVPALGPRVDDDGLIEDYLRWTARAKLRRLTGLIALCAVLLAVLLLIYGQGWYSGSGGGGAGWVFVGIGVSAAAIAAVVIDILYRKEL
ncbi:hypothetical protein LWC35_14770 [Pseudonocardia kujensis]|uniref:hypothetical protein n=1 Tax=Pseudonocardia kujensis TaxID=1128675 RepID=UPI001E5C5AC7|nr:hypothetical protein [Pseudonocardia kujensis]MCE0764164.1 hypothetical protein [Pseudonocardia kujensis]